MIFFVCLFVIKIFNIDFILIIIFLLLLLYIYIFTTIPDGNYNCDYKTDILNKIVSAKLPEKNQGTYDFVKQFSYSEDHQTYMLGLLHYQNKTLNEAACEWIKAHPSVWQPNMPAVSTLTASTVHEGVSGIFMGLAALVIVCCLGLMVFIFVNRRVRIILSASPTFLLLILIGAILSCVNVFLLYQETLSENNCVAAAWARHLGFGIIFAALFLKTYRIARVFKVKSAKSVVLNDTRLLLRFLEILAGFAIYLTAWTVINKPTLQKKVASGLYYNACTFTWWDSALLIIEISCMSVLAAVCFNVRKAPSAFNESKFISLSVYNWVVLGILLQIILQSTSGSASFYYALQSLEILLTVPVAVSLIFASKVYLFLKGKGADVSTSNFNKTSLGNTKTPDGANEVNNGSVERHSSQTVDEERHTGGSIALDTMDGGANRSSFAANNKSSVKPSTSAKADAQEIKLLKAENARLLKECEQLRTMVLRLNNPHSLQH